MKQFFLFLVTLTIILQTSCSKDPLSEQNNQEYSVSDIIAGFNENYALFEDFKSISHFLKEFQKMGDEEQKSLIRRLSYKTRAKELSSQYAKIETFNSEVSARSFILNNPFFEIKLTSGGSEIALEKGRSHHLIYPFLNKDGIIKIGDEYQKYFSDYMISSKKYSEIKDIYSVEQAEKLNLKPKKVVTLLTGKELDQRSNEINFEFFKELIHDPSGCSNDRRIQVSQGCFESIVSFGGLTTHLIDFFFEARPFKKGIICIFYNYSTNVKIFNFNYAGNTKFTVGTQSVNSQNFLITHPNVEVNTNCFEKKGGLNSILRTEPYNAFAMHTNRRVDVYAQGMNNMWLVINNN